VYAVTIGRMPSIRARIIRLVLVAAIAVAAQTSGSSTDGGAPAAASTRARVTGGDISWPQCPKSMGIPSRRGQDKPMPLRSARFAIIGLTNGPGFFPDPCLASLVKRVEHRHMYAAAYAMTTYPRPRQLRRYGAAGPHHHRHLTGRLWNAGYAEATFNLATMKKVGLVSPIIWVDVEPYPVAPWSGNRAHNAQVVRGAVKAYQDAGYRVGFYSTSTLWPEVVGRLRYGYPEWRTAGQTSLGSALDTCSHHQFQGGRAVVAQWWTPDRDFDVMCPGDGRRTVLKRYFTKY
jgi:hypothetical protein